MVSLKKKIIKGHTYWYAVEMARIDGKPKQVWQKYLGTAEKIVELKEKASELPHIKLKSFQYGKTSALLSISDELNFIETVNKHTNKKKIEGLTVGEYLLLNIIGRCDGALSENAMQKWFDKSSLSILWKFPHKLTCQNFLNHYKYIDQETSEKIEDDLCRVLIEKGITPQILFLDETNWFNYIKKGEELPQNGNNKQYRNHMKQVCMGLTVSEDNVPFMHEVYEGNKHDAKIFPELLDTLTKRLSNLEITTEDMILVFDKGNNSQINIKDVMSKMHIVASAKHNQAEELLNVPFEDYKHLYTNPQGNKIYGYRTKHEFFGLEFTTVVLYNEASYKKQMKGYEERKVKICEKLNDLKKRLENNRGKERDKSSVEREVNDIIRKDFRSIFGNVLD
jgi:transposase